ncbi:glycosyltransferase family 4 protein [Kouleothrix sp.]|uniref:glycosyltransferase family 4 protein n=1 Tax=Kouleothrix sp. TaxID=2779161 RepID=UPI00391882F3
MTSPRVAFITVGDTRRLTGGYLYHARVFAALREGGIALDEVVASAAALPAQLERAAAFGGEFDPRPFDVVVVDALARAVCAPWLDRWRALRPVVAMVHELPSLAGGGAAELEAPLLRSDLLIAVSAHGQAALERRGVPAGRIRVVQPGCDRLHAPALPTPPSPEEAALRAAAVGQPPSAVALCVAQWIPRKGLLELVQAWASAPRSPALLELVGENDADPAYAAEVRAAIARASAAAPILVRGTLDDAALTRAYASAALFVLPSAFEGYGMAYAEALAFGLPVVACATGPLPELVGDAGLLLPPGDPGALAGALARLLGDAGLRERLGRAARRRSHALPTWADAARRFAGVLHEARLARR